MNIRTGGILDRERSQLTTIPRSQFAYSVVCFVLRLARVDVENVRQFGNTNFFW